MKRRSTTGANPFAFQGFDATTDLLRGPVKPKRPPKEDRPSGPNHVDNALRGFIRQAGAVARRSPEVMVRITGGAKGLQPARNASDKRRATVPEHLAYITRNGKLEATNERGEVVTGREAVKDVAKEWLVDGQQRGQTPDTRNLMLSMPPGTDPEKVLRAAKTFADKAFAGERSYLIALHTDQEHPHVHLTLKTRGFDGKNLHPRKADLQQWREDFAHELRELGVAAEATPRRARGVVQKAQRQAVHHIERDHKAGKRDRRSQAQLAKFAEAVKEITGKEAPKTRPWELKIAERQKQIREGWLKTAGVLDQAGTGEAKALAKDIRAFVADMPPIATERQKIRGQVEKQLREQLRQRERGQDR